MRIKKVSMKQFRRFSQTEITNIPETAKLIIIAGPNGCGKSSFFDALNTWKKINGGQWGWTPEYHIKQNKKGELPPREATKVIFHGSQPQSESEIRKSIYIRSAYRNDPEFQLGSLTRMGSALEENRLGRLIDNDAAVSQNYQRLAGQALEDVHEKADGAMTIAQYREESIGEIKSATSRLFPDLAMNSLGNPLTTGTFKFDKGESKSFVYMNLSGGEKAAFDLILDMYIKRREFTDTVFCIDEPEAHMNSRLQGSLLRELYKSISGKSQLWLATHSAGMMREARDIERENPGTIVFLDFGGRDFDEPQVIAPEKPNRLFWEKVLDVAFDDMAALIAPTEVVICEGKPLVNGGRHEAIDASCYDVIFAEQYPETRFISGGSSGEIEDDRLSLVRVIEALVKGTKVRRLLDRDDRSEAEVSSAKDIGISVLNRRHLESFLFDDEVIRALCIERGRTEAFVTLKAEKDRLLDASISRGNPFDDVKSISGPLYVAIKKELQLRQCGNTVKEFMRNILAHHVQPGMAVYEELRQSIF